MKDLILGNHLYFAREGDDDGGTAVSATHIPDAESELWTKLPTVEDWEPKRTPNNVIRRAPSPGTYRTRKTIQLSSKMTHAFSLQEWSEMTFAELLLGGEKPVSGVFVPDARGTLLTGWWMVLGYDQTESKIITLNVWGEGMIDGYKFGERLDPYALIVEQLYSTLNSAKAENLS